MKNKFIVFFSCSLFFSVNSYCQFNTVLQKKDIPKTEPVLATTENKIDVFITIEQPKLIRNIRV